MSRKKNSRAASGSGSIRQRPDGKWEGRYYAGVHAGTGKPIRKSVYADTQSEALRRLRQITQNIDNGVFTEPSKMTVTAWFNVWLSEYCGNLKERSRVEYRRVVEYRVIPALGAVKLSELRAPAIQKLYNDAMKSSKTIKGLSPKTIMNLHGVIHKALSVAVNLQYISLNPADAVTLPRTEKVEINPLDSIQTAAFLSAIAGHKFETLYKTALFTGCRQGELLGLNWNCVNFDAGTITIKQQLQRVNTEYKIVSVKNDKPRTFKPATSVMELLKQHKKAQTEQRLRAGSLWDNPWNLVFTNELGKHLLRGVVYSQYKRITLALGFESRFHDLRHSYATASLLSGVDIKTLQTQLGHSAISMTLDLYGHVTDDMQDAAASKMELYIQSLKSC